jgi:hypothetical protein
MPQRIEATMGAPDKNLKRSRRRSAQAIPAHAAVLLALGAAIWIATRFIRVPGWLAALILAMGILPLVLDVANVIYCAQRKPRS